MGMNEKVAPIPVMAISVPVNFAMVKFVMNKLPNMNQINNLLNFRK